MSDFLAVDTRSECGGFVRFFPLFFRRLCDSPENRVVVAWFCSPFSVPLREFRVWRKKLGFSVRI